MYTRWMRTCQRNTTFIFLLTLWNYPQFQWPLFPQCSHCDITQSQWPLFPQCSHCDITHSLSGHCSHNAHTVTLPTVSVATVPTMLTLWHYPQSQWPLFPQCSGLYNHVMNFTNKTQMDYFITSKRAKFIWFTKENYFDFLNRVRLRHMQSQNKRGKCQSSRQSMCTDA